MDARQSTVKLMLLMTNCALIHRRLASRYLASELVSRVLGVECLNRWPPGQLKHPGRHHGLQLLPSFPRNTSVTCVLLLLLSGCHAAELRQHMSWCWPCYEQECSDERTGQQTCELSWQQGAPGHLCCLPLYDPPWSAPELRPNHHMAGKRPQQSTRLLPSNTVCALMRASWVCVCLNMCSSSTMCIAAWPAL